ncbi:hypothetical protein EV1_001628 [Malus domestica]
MRLAERREGGTRRRKTTAASSWTGREKAFCSPLAVFVQIQVTSLYGGPLEFMFIVQSTEDPAYRAVSMLLSELKDEVDAKIVVAGISTTCSQKIHNQLAQPVLPELLENSTTKVIEYCRKHVEGRDGDSTDVGKSGNPFSNCWVQKKKKKKE